ncbi:MAG: RNA-binding protein hfq [Microcoleaceae cyanobacterium]
MSEFDIGLPSIRQIQTYLKEKQTVEIKLTTNDLLEGTVSWQDQNCICIQDAAQQNTLVWRQTIAYMKAKT